MNFNDLIYLTHASHWRNIQFSALLPSEMRLSNQTVLEWAAVRCHCHHHRTDEMLSAYNKNKYIVTQLALNEEESVKRNHETD